MNITILRDGQNYGPYTLEQIKEYLGNGTLNESDLAWQEGMSDWLPLKDVISPLPLSPSPAKLPPPPPPVVNPLAPALNLTASETTQPKVDIIVKTSGNKRLSVGKVVGSIFAFVGIIVLVAIWLYTASPTTGSLVSDASALTNPAPLTIASPSATGDTATPETASHTMSDTSSQSKAHSDVPSGDKYYYVNQRDAMQPPNAILILTKTNSDFYLTFLRMQLEEMPPYYVEHMTYHNKNEDADHIDYGQVDSDIFAGPLHGSTQHDTHVVYTKSSDSFDLTFSNGNRFTFTRQEPDNLQASLDKAKALLVDYNTAHNSTNTDPTGTLSKGKSNAQRAQKAILGTWSAVFNADAGYGDVGATTKNRIRLTFGVDSDNHGIYRLYIHNGDRQQMPPQDLIENGYWRVQGDGTIALDQVLPGGSVPIPGDECSLPKNDEITLAAGALGGQITLKKE